MRRDSWMQHHDAKVVSTDPGRAKPGDLMFFAENKGKISHVGIALGNFKILHARGFVKINSLNPKDKLFDQHLQDTFADVRTIFD
jgi:cell wall-associated NlpC family hydrolase